MTKSKILIVLPTLSAGGAERVLSFVADNLNTSNFIVKLVIVGHKKDAVYTTKNIPTLFLDKDRVRHGVLPIIKLIFKEKPAIVLSSIGHLNTIIALLSPFFPKTKFIIREASVISTMAKHSNTSKIYSILAKISYPWLDGFICQSKDMANDFQCLFRIDSSKLTVINNPITSNLADLNVLATTKDGPLKYISIGRLSKEKGQKRIIKILSNLNIPFHYTIIGSGPEEEELKVLVHQLNMSHKVTFITHTTDVNSYLKENHFFLQGSYVEGFPNTVLESCAVGTPVIAFNVPGGTKEIIEHSKNGFLVETESEYFNMLTKKVAWDASQIKSNIKKRFSSTTIISSYENFFKTIISS